MKGKFDSLLGSKTAIFIAGMCGLILITKVALAFRINVNWDEFFFLSHVYDFERGELGSRFQTAYVHLFGWVTSGDGNELDRVVAARLAMSALFIVSILLLARLAARWVSASVAWIAPLAFLSSLPVLRHGASFRSDSLLLPLMLLACVCLVSKRLDWRRIAIAGAALGASIAISLKSVLIAPLLVLLLGTNWAGIDGSWRDRAAASLARIAGLGVCTALAAGVLLGLHWLSLPASDVSTVQGYASGVARKTVLETPFFPRWDYFSRSLESDWLMWMLIGAGVLAALRGYWRAALLALALLPLLFYRNAFPYYYVIMLAPASVLAAIAVEQLRRLPGIGAFSGQRLPVIMSVFLAMQAGLHLFELRHDGQDDQRATIDAVHDIFPEPVPYIDHSGMIASFPKLNNLMSSWSMENYRSRGLGFMAKAIAENRPPMVLANHAVLMPGTAAFELLFDDDQYIIESLYLPYWGAIRIAGGEAALESEVAAHLEVPFPGRYRLEADRAVVVNGVVHAPGDEIEIPEPHAPGSALVRSETAQTVRLVWAQARPAPPGALPPFIRLYANL